MPAREPREGASIVRWRLSWIETSRLQMEACLSQMETQHLRMAAPHSWYGNAAVRTFGRAHRRRPYGFVWGIVRVNGWIRLGGLRVGRLISFGWITHKWYFVCVGLRGKI